jgi:hypothetical protein
MWGPPPPPFFSRKVFETGALGLDFGGKVLKIKDDSKVLQ